MAYTRISGPVFSATAEGEANKKSAIDRFIFPGTIEYSICAKLKFSQSNTLRIQWFRDLIGKTEQEVFGNRGISEQNKELMLAMFAEHGFVIEGREIASVHTASLTSPARPARGHQIGDKENVTVVDFGQRPPRAPTTTREVGLETAGNTSKVINYFTPRPR